jgi:hypothetical protein
MQFFSCCIHPDGWTPRLRKGAVENIRPSEDASNIQNTHIGPSEDVANSRNTHIGPSQDVADIQYIHTRPSRKVANILSSS